MKFLLIPFFTFFSFHDFHTSLAEMEYNAASGAFEISLRVFTDDLEKAVSLHHGLPATVLDRLPEADRKIEKYLEGAFQVSFDGRKLPYKYLGKQVEHDVTWIYLELPYTGRPQTGLIRHAVFTELFKDQSNIVNFRMGDFKGSLLLTGDVPEKSFGIR